MTGSPEPAGVPDGLLREVIRDVLRELVREEVRAALAEGGPDAPSYTRAASGATARPAPAASTPTRIERGPLTERMVDAARAAGSITVARGVAVTPLAKDRARALGVTIVKES